MIHFNDLYIHIDEGTLWSDQTFRTHYNHYHGADEDWSKPYEEWKEWFLQQSNRNTFLTLEKFLDNNWSEIEGSIEDAHEGFINLFKEGTSKSEIFLSFIYMFSDLDHSFENNLYLDIDDIRVKSPIQSQEDTETLQRIDEDYMEDYNGIDSDELEI